MKVLLALTLALLFLSPAALAADEPLITRAQLVGTLWGRLGAIPFDAQGPFSDVSPTSAHASAISWAAHEGLTAGTGADCFAPDRPATREETALLLRRTAHWLAWPDAALFFPDGLTLCNDGDGLSPWSDGSLYWACTSGLLEWSPGGLLDPQGGLTASALNAALDRFFAP